MDQKDNSFWIFFDTSTVAAYYLDVHNILSLPSGFIYRYNYRKTHLTDKVLALLHDSENQPSKVLFVYSQLKSYKKGQKTPGHPNDFNDMIWVPFRIGELINIPNPNDNGINFDLKVGPYPNVDNEEIYTVLKQLYSEGITPYNKWVTIVENIDYLNNLLSPEKLNPNRYWEKIINFIGSPPSQFYGDSFWKIQIEDLSENIIEPKLNCTSYHNSSIYLLKDDTEYVIRVKSHTPPGLDRVEPPTLKNQRNIVIECNDENVIKFSCRESLRQYTEFPIKFKTKKIRGFGSRNCKFNLFTKNGRSEYYLGPGFSIDVIVTQKMWELIVGYLSLIIALFLFVISVNLIITGNLIFFITLLLGIVLALCAGYFLWREPKFIFN